MGIQDAVAFIGNIPSNDIPSYLASSDIYVSTSTSDSGIAASTAEAMACGVPVISTDVADIRIWVLDGKNGYVIPKGDGHALSSRINALLSDPAAWRLMGQEARRTIVERQDYRTEMAKMGSIYMRLVEEGTK
jgi:glycosyltransferase involved in cell wall biosynthesis